MSDAPPADIRPLGPVAEFRAAEELQRRVWGFVDVEVIPLHVLITAAKNGGLALGAFEPGKEGGELVGFLFGFPGRDALGGKHCSHILGVVPEARGRGVGAAMKWAQREWAREQGFPRITWTYDPLMAGNARFNLHHLGAECRRYLVDVYGEIRDDLNRGMPTDRFEVDWWLDEPPVVARAMGERPPEIDPSTIPAATGSREERGERVPAGWRDPVAERIRVEIPADLLALKARDPELALAWSALARETLPALFAAGYVATDLLRGEGRAFYLLERPEAAN